MLFSVELPWRWAPWFYTATQGSWECQDFPLCHDYWYVADSHRCRLLSWRLLAWAPPGPGLMLLDNGFRRGCFWKVLFDRKMRKSHDKCLFGIWRHLALDSYDAIFYGDWVFMPTYDLDPRQLVFPQLYPSTLCRSSWKSGRSEKGLTLPRWMSREQGLKEKNRSVWCSI